MIHRRGWRHLSAPIAVETLAGVAVLEIAPHSFAPAPFVVAALVVAFSGSIAAFVRSRRQPVSIWLADDRLYVGGEPFSLATAWLSRDWLVLRGRLRTRRARIAIHRSEVEDAAFARLRRHAISALPRVNRLRVAGRRADR